MKAGNRGAISRRGWLVAALLGVLFWGDGGKAAAQNPEPEEVAPIERLQKLISGLTTLEGDFTQESFSEGRGRLKVSQGHLTAARPGRFRWDYQQPYEQIIVSDGKLIWYYEPDLKQVTQVGATGLDRSPASVLVDGKPIKETFDWEEVPGEQGKAPSIRLTPKKESNFRKIQITLHPKRDQLLSMEVEDTLGNRSVIYFENLVVNRKLDPGLFTFKIPPGVDLIEQ
ncbi:MAG: outer membrane lipoprotein chaperone LolA [Magnetococcales bacterium]|nr:outer membrane lipoprotein chaperone LolA [Magnetococcales bacterium]